MRAILLLGWKGSYTSAAPEPLYCGTDAAEAQRIATAAQNGGLYTFINRMHVAPSMGAKLPVVPHPESVSQEPKSGTKQQPKFSRK